MSWFRRLRYYVMINTLRYRRYSALFQEIEAHRCRRILEIGVYDGRHARQMIETAALHHPPGEIDYYGFDLFEALTDQMLAKEFSKRPLSCEAIRTRLEKTGANIYLYPGNTLDTLPANQAAIGEVDFAFIDGGHSIATIASDWSSVEKMIGPRTTVVFDDYYADENPETEGLGCQTLIEALDRAKYDVTVLATKDAIRQEWGKLVIQMVKVTWQSSQTARRSPGRNAPR